MSIGYAIDRRGLVHESNAEHSGHNGAGSMGLTMSQTDLDTTSTCNERNHVRPPVPFSRSRPLLRSSSAPPGVEFNRWYVKIRTI